MTSSKNLSRRKIALEFLSNISLDKDISVVDEKANDNYTVTLTSNVDSREYKSEENLIEPIFEEASVSKYLELDYSKSVSFQPFRERTNTGSSDHCKFWEIKQRKRVAHQPSLCEDIGPSHYFSSCESIPSSRNRGESFDSRTSKQKEVRVVQPGGLQHCKNDRIIFLIPKTKTPFYVFSFIPYKKTPKSKLDGKKEGTGRRRNLSGSRPLSSFMDVLDPFLYLLPEKNSDDQMISYNQLLTPSRSFNQYNKCCCNHESFTDERKLCRPVTRCMSVDLSYSPKLRTCTSYSPTSSDFKGAGCSDWEESKYSIGTCNACYDPCLLDDPEFISGRHRTVITFTAYRTSVIDYVKSSDLKKSLNEKFRKRFPYIQLTLSKLRSLKKDMRKIARVEGSIDLLTVAQAYVYFEKLVLKGVITKTNRKLCAAICLILSAKMNDTKGNILKSLFEKLESIFRLNHKDILASELPVLVALEFSLHVPTWEVLPHFHRLLRES